MAAVTHQATHDVVALLTALSEHQGWLSTGDVSTRADVPRDTARRMLAQLAECGWVQRATDPMDGADRWVLGAELPRLALAFQARLVNRARALLAEHQALIPADLSATLSRPIATSSARSED